MFMLCIGGTVLAKVPGLSAAGAEPEATLFTAPADADVIRCGRPKVIDVLPIDPEGHPTPALITRAAILEAEIQLQVMRAGSFIPPTPPYIELGAEVGRDPRTEPSLPDAQRIVCTAADLGGNTADPFIMIGESVPGGTTTALLILRALGYHNMVSSAGPKNPTALKEAVWRNASARLGRSLSALAQDPLQALTELGDPMQAAVFGFVQGLPPNTEVVLAGGTQMLAVAALLKAMGLPKLPLVATTRYVMEDPSADFAKLAEAIGVETYAAPLDFSNSPHAGLRDYERGYVKEGVGAGGAVLYADRKGVPVDRIIARTNKLYADMPKA